MPWVHNPEKLIIYGIGQTLVRTDLVDAKRVRRAVDLVWRHIFTGLTRVMKE